MLFFLLAGARKKVPQERKSAGHRKEQELFPECLALMATLAISFLAVLVLGDEHVGKFRKVHAALVARAAMRLHSAASAADEPQRLVAARAETRGDRIVNSASRTEHARILAGFQRWRAIPSAHGSQNEPHAVARAETSQSTSRSSCGCGACSVAGVEYRRQFPRSKWWSQITFPRDRRIRLWCVPCRRR